MALFFGSFVVFALVATALGASLLIKGRTLKVGCGSACADCSCDDHNQPHRTCNGICQRGHP